jgi:putative tryptophan/tyrosine transport system substrate-binding protein
VKRREFIAGLGGAAAWPTVARAQQPERIRRVGVLVNAAADDAEYQARFGAFLQGLQQAGWTIGRNVRIDTRWAGANAADIHRHAMEFAALSPDVILATGSLAVGALKQATATVPIVFVGIIDPVGVGFIDSLGFLLWEYGLSAKWLELLKEIAPSTTRAAVLRDPAVSSGPAQFGVIQGAAQSLGRCRHKRRCR